MNNLDKEDIIIISSNDWNGFWYQRQQFALEFSLLGHRVIYFNRTLQQWPKLRHLFSFINNIFNFNKNIGYKNINLIKNIKIINSILLPPTSYFRFINKSILKYIIKKLNIKNPILITYVPSFNSLDLIEIIKPKKVIYVNVHNFDDDNVLKDLLKAEKELIKKADLLFADSIFNKQRIQRISKDKKIYLSPPGVNFNNFKNAFRGDEVDRLKTVYYFGGIGSHLDLELYNLVAEKFDVIFIGSVINANIKSKISHKIKIIPPVTNDKLPKYLKEADILALFYKNNEYIKGVLPAKFFECVSTGKPILVSGLYSLFSYKDIVYDVNGLFEIFIDTIKKLKINETKEKINNRFRIGEESDWKERFKNFKEHIYFSES